jgi:alpha-mannosidase
MKNLGQLPVLTGRKKDLWKRREFIAAVATITAATGIPVAAFACKPREVFLVPNFHPASCGWLANFSKERIYCANTYLTHLDRVRDDPNYSFALSEINNIIAIMNFQPDRIPELKRRVVEKRVELINGYFLESTINLSGGEALVRLGVMGLRWYEKIFGYKPRFSWNIDVCGTHDQMPQIAAGLGMEALIYTRANPTGKTMYWSVSPDGTRILTISPGEYAEAGPVFHTPTPLNADDLKKLEAFFDTKEPITPEGAPIVCISGYGDYNTAPKVKEYPSLFLKQWAESQPQRKVQFTTLSKYVDTVMPGLRSGKIKVPTHKGGTAYDFDSFWIENYRVKTQYKRNEHQLQAAEALSAIASLQGRYEYPVKALSDCWVLMCLNMDRNTLWGSAGGMVFVDEKSWDVQDRFHWVNKTTGAVLEASASSLIAAGEHVALFNPLSWKRSDPIELRLPEGKSLEGVTCEALPEGTALCQIDMLAMSVGGWKLSSQAPAVLQTIPLPDVIGTNHYDARIDAKTGALISLKLKKSGRELLAGPANVVVAERPVRRQPDDDPADHMAARPDRERLATSSDKPAAVEVKRGPLSTTVKVSGEFYMGGAIRRTMRLYANSPRIDFETELNDIPEHTVVVSEFPLADEILEVRRGIPYGFSHGAWSKPNENLHGWAKGIVPAVRWIDFSFEKGGGFAILDRGLSGRELNGRTPIIYLMNAEDKYWGYDNPWLSGKGKNVVHYSVVAHDSHWEDARIPHMAWEYNREPAIVANRGAAPVQSFLETSSNVIVEALRREGDHIELRMVEVLGRPGNAEINLNLPHRAVALTDLVGRKVSNLPPMSRYTIALRPQQIVTMHFETSATLAEAEPIVSWEPFVPKEKLPALRAYDPKLIGHPPSGK